MAGIWKREHVHTFVRRMHVRRDHLHDIGIPCDMESSVQTEEVLSGL